MDLIVACACPHPFCTLRSVSKVFCERRRAYDMTSARVAGTEAAQFVKPKKGKSSAARWGGAAGAAGGSLCGWAGAFHLLAITSH